MKRALITNMVVVLTMASAGQARAADIIGILRDGSGPYYEALSTKVKTDLAAKHPGYRVVVSTPAATKMARCNSARRFAKVGCEIIVALGPGVAAVTIQECDHPMVFGVYDVGRFDETAGHATGVVWAAPPSRLLDLLRKMRPVSRIGVVRGNPGPESERELEAIQVAAKKLAIAVVALEAEPGAALGNVDAVYFAGMFGGEAEALERLSVLAMQARKPVVTSLVGGGAKGALLTQQVDIDAIANGVVAAVERIMAGAEPEEVPRVRRGAIIVVNPAIAKALGLKIPAEVSRAAAESVK